MHRLEIDEDRNYVKIYGHITSENVSEVQMELDEIIGRKNNLTLDLNNISEIDIAGLYMLFIYRKNNSASEKNIKILLDPCAVFNHCMPMEMQLKLINNN